MLTFGAPASGGLVLGGAAADRYFAHLQTLVARPAYGARFAAAGAAVEIIPAKAGVSLDVPLSAASVLAAAERTHDRVAQLVLDAVHVGRTTAAARGDGITGLVGSYETIYGGIAEPDPQRPARRAPRRRQADRARRDLLVQPGDRRAHRGEGLPRGAGDHQRRGLRPGSAAASARSRRRSSTPPTRPGCRSRRARTTRSTSRTTRSAATRPSTTPTST